jgi:hypothetical protein
MQYRNGREESTLVTTIYKTSFCRFRIEANHTFEQVDCTIDNAFNLRALVLQEFL